MATAGALRTRLWPVPTLAVVVAIAAGVGVPQLDVAIDDSLPPAVTDFLFGGGPDAARELLGSIAASLITVTSLTFSLTVVTLQLASSQFSPRLLRTFARDRFVQRTLALFLATFVYGLTVLRTVRTGTDGEADFVPMVSVTLAYVLAVLSVLGLVLFLAHLVREIRVETMVDNVYTEAVATARRVCGPADPDRPADPNPPRPPPQSAPIPGTGSGFVTSVDEDALTEAAEAAGAIVLVDRTPGSSVVAGTPVAFAWPADTATDLDAERLATLRRAVAGAITLGPERTETQDVGYGVRQLTDVAVKALSPGINDPTTAIHTLGRSAALLCELAGRKLGPKTLRDKDGQARVVLRRPDLTELLDAAVGQPRRYGAADPAVLARLFRLLRDLAWCTRLPTHADAVADQLRRLRVTVSGQDFDAVDRAHLEQLSQAVEAALAGVWPPHTDRD
ncbi:DUF2254 domain-containing protein (plasmid) [Rhodococcus opacus]|uniref:DUF2254 domain-containing protein n=1 Tax=Rhodococcus opacus TaxID=37919 RepID=UPI0034D2C189